MVLPKRVYSQHPAGWTGAGPHDALAELLAQDPSGRRLTGAALLKQAQAKGMDPSFDDVLVMAPPIGASQFATLRFTGNREATMDVFFDHRADAHQWSGQPRPDTVITESLDYNRTLEGLVGGEV